MSSCPCFSVISASVVSNRLATDEVAQFPRVTVTFRNFTRIGLQIGGITT